MDTRMDKYTSEDSNSRSSRNKKLYEELYNTGTYTNSVVIDQSKEIDISKIKEIIDKEKSLSEKKVNKPEINFDNLTKKEIEQRVYDINEVLKSAKEKRDIIEEASEKRKNSKYESHLDIEEELSKTRKVYDKLLQEETELLDIMNTLANVQSENNGDNTNTYKDITKESKTVTVQRINLPNEKVEVLDEVEGDDKTTTEYSTNTFMFNKKDFSDDELEEEIKESNAFIKVLIFLLIIAIILGAYYIVTTYILK